MEKQDGGHHVAEQNGGHHVGEHRKVAGGGKGVFLTGQAEKETGVLKG